MNLITVALPAGAVINLTATQLYEMELHLRGGSLPEPETPEVTPEPEATEVAEPEAPEVAEPEATPEPVKRGRGRPRKTENADGDEPVATVKRPRGRPRKTAPTAPVEPIVEDTETEEAPEPNVALRDEVRNLVQRFLRDPESSPAKQAGKLKEMMAAYDATGVGSIPEDRLAEFRESMESLMGDV